MKLANVWLVAEMQGRELRRRWPVVFLLIAMPVLFYFGIGGRYGVLTAVLGLGWALGSAALFTVVASRRCDPRLVLSGFHPPELLLGRLLLLLGVGCVVATLLGLLIELVSRHLIMWAVVLALAAVVATAVTLGMTVAALVPRELEGTLIIILLVGMQMTLPNSSSVAGLLPLYGASRLVQLGVGYSHGPAGPWLVDAALFAFGLAAFATLVWSRRIRVREAPNGPEGVPLVLPANPIGAPPDPPPTDW